jgi:hypothetical protein
MILNASHAILFLQYNHVLVFRYSWKFLCNRVFNQCIFKRRRGWNFTLFHVYKNMKEMNCFHQSCIIGYQFCEDQKMICRECSDFDEYCFKNNRHIANCLPYIANIYNCTYKSQKLETEYRGIMDHLYVRFAWPTLFQHLSQSRHIIFWASQNWYPMMQLWWKQFISMAPTVIKLHNLLS